jgi:hypothetical protein
VVQNATPNRLESALSMLWWGFSKLEIKHQRVRYSLSGLPP